MRPLGDDLLELLVGQLRMSLRGMLANLLEQLRVVIGLDVATSACYITSPEWYHTAMERTQISLTAGQARELRRLARRRGTSMAALIREAVDRTYGASSEEPDRWKRALASVGGFRSGRSDVSERHDDLLAEAYGQ